MSHGSGSRVGGKENGDLLSLAEDAFDVLITVDINLSYQQNLAGRKIAIVVIRSPSNRLDHLRQFFPACAAALKDNQAWAYRFRRRHVLNR